MEWSPQQSAALKKIAKWLVDPRAPQVMRVFGFAGTGKTTLAKEIAANVRGTVLFGTFTGKASLVLRKKGCTGATTLHSLIYKPEEDEATGHTEFILNGESPLLGAALLLLDECSMVGPELGSDVLSFGCKVLVLGDPFQLPPINGEGFFTAQEPDVLLTEIHRQAADNPIIRMSMEVRAGKALLPGSYGDSRIITRLELRPEDVLDADQVIVGKNDTRQQYNARIRTLKKLEGVRPVMGDRLVCLKNNRTKGLLNGSLWEPYKIEPEGNTPHMVKMIVASLDEPDKAIPVDVKTPIEYFLGTQGDLEWPIRKKSDEFTYGWALTCHKAQGSQYDNVFLTDQSKVFREHAQRWLYTGITRAAERVTIYQP